MATAIFILVVGGGLEGHAHILFLYHLIEVFWFAQWKFLFAHGKFHRKFTFAGGVSAFQIIGKQNYQCCQYVSPSHSLLYLQIALPNENKLVKKGLWLRLHQKYYFDHV